MNDRKAIVTGGSTGIGAAIVSALIEHGYEVIALARRPAELKSARLRSVQVDLADVEATRTAVAEIAAREAITTIVHNAGAILEKPIEEVRAADIDTLAHLHLTAALTLVQANLAAMRAARFGRIVLISSRAVLCVSDMTLSLAFALLPKRLESSWRGSWEIAVLGPGAGKGQA